MELVFKCRDWESPDGELITGKTIKGELVHFTKSQIQHAIREGFHHLVDGTFLCYKTKGCRYNLALETIHSVTNVEGDLVELVYTGDGNRFEVIETK